MGLVSHRTFQLPFRSLLEPSQSAAVCFSPLSFTVISLYYCAFTRPWASHSQCQITFHTPVTGVFQSITWSPPGPTQTGFQSLDLCYQLKLSKERRQKMVHLSPAGSDRPWRRWRPSRWRRRCGTPRTWGWAARPCGPSSWWCGPEAGTCAWSSGWSAKPQIQSINTPDSGLRPHESFYCSDSRMEGKSP